MRRMLLFKSSNLPTSKVEVQEMIDFKLIRMFRNKCEETWHCAFFKLQQNCDQIYIHVLNYDFTALNCLAFPCFVHKSTLKKPCNSYLYMYDLVTPYDHSIEYFTTDL
jgi:hypothetical protein